MPKWLAEKIAANTRRAHEATCTRCGSPVLAGPDGKLAAITAMVDTTPTNQTGELRALINGRRTYTLIDNELDLRDHFAGVETRPIYLEHTCQEATP